MKGQNVFSKAATTPPLLSPPLNQAPVLPLSSPFNTSTTTPTLGSSPSAKSFGFGAFASTSSPFPSVTGSKSPVVQSTFKLDRAKSPSRRGQPSAHPNAFSPYASGVQGFAVAASKRARAGSPNNSSRSSLERNGRFRARENSNGVFDSEPEDEKEDGRASSFGERLRAGRDDDDENKSEDEQNKVVLTEQDGGLYWLHIVLSDFMVSFSSHDG